MNIVQNAYVVMLASSTFLSFAAMPDMAWAQSTPQELANEFAIRMADGVEEIAVSAEVTSATSNQALAGGYYQLVVEPVSGGGRLTDLDCKKNLKNKTGNKTFFDLLTNNTRDVGMALELPVVSPASPEAKAELNLFRLTKAGGSKCRVEQSPFALRSASQPFATPLMPLAMRPRAGGEVLQVKFRPWSATTQDEGRMAALWNGVGAFAKLLGPVGAFASSLFTKDEDPWALRGPAKASFFEITGIDPSLGQLTEAKSGPAITKFYRPIRLIPDLNADTPVSALSATWSFDGKSGSKVPIGYRVLPKFKASRITDTDKFENVDQSRQGLVDLISRAADFSDKSWQDIMPSIANLRVQGDATAFSAACTPALRDLENLHLSKPDQMLLLYAIARGKLNFSDEALNGISCLAGDDADLALKKFGIVIARIVKNNSDDSRLAARVLASAFLNPSNLGQLSTPPGRLDVMVKGPIRTAISEDLSMSDNQPFGDGPIVQDRFLERFRQINFLSVTGCLLLDWNGRMPPSAVGLDTEENPIAMLGRRGVGPVFLIVAGLGTKQVDGNSGLPPRMTSLFVADTFDPADNVIKNIRDKMRLLPLGDGPEQCDRDGSFAGFFAPPAEIVHAPVTEPSAATEPETESE